MKKYRLKTVPDEYGDELSFGDPGPYRAKSKEEIIKHSSFLDDWAREWADRWCGNASNYNELYYDRLQFLKAKMLEALVEVD